MAKELTVTRAQFLPDAVMVEVAGRWRALSVKAALVSRDVTAIDPDSGFPVETFTLEGGVLIENVTRDPVLVALTRLYWAAMLNGDIPVAIELIRVPSSEEAVQIAKRWRPLGGDNEKPPTNRSLARFWFVR